MAQRGPIRHGREAFARQEWRLAFTELSAAEQAGKLEPDDLEQLAAAAYLVGEESRAVSLWTRLHHDLVDRGNLDRAARCGFWLSLNLLLSGETARSTGWLARSERLLKEREAASADPGYGRVVAGLLALGGGDAETARGHFRAAMALAEKFRDTDLLTISLLSEGQLLIESQRIAEGIARLDEAMLAVSAGEVSPIYAGIVYCADDPRVRRGWRSPRRPPAVPVTCWIPRFGEQHLNGHDVQTDTVMVGECTETDLDIEGQHEAVGPTNTSRPAGSRC